MKQIEYAANEERTLLTALIVHDGVLGRIQSRLQGGKPFRSKWSNLVAGWCFEHFSKYKRAPRRDIVDHLQRYAATSRNTKAVELVEQFLEGLSGEYDALASDLNESFVMDIASRHFRTVQLEQVREELEASLDRKDVDQAEEVVSSYRRPVIGASVDSIDPCDKETIQRALRPGDHRELITFPGDLGKFLSPHFERDGFISFVGPEKRGKSFWLMETAFQAMLQRRRVLYYVVGDMSEEQVMRRLIVRASRRPLEIGTIQRPVAIEPPEDIKEVPEVEFQRVRHRRPLSVFEAQAAMNKLLLRTGALKSRLKLKCQSSSSLSASGIESDIRDHLQEDWMPDVVVIDYADLLAPESTSRDWDYRHQVNETWKVLRRISQDFHILVVTATQAAASSYGSWIVTKRDFSEDKRKNAHVTGMIGINQTTAEKECGVFRLNWVFLRDGGRTDSQVVWTAGNLAIACPCICSTLSKKGRT